LYNTLSSVFPEVNFSVKSFQRYIWRKVENRRNFFEEFASSRKFDPLNPRNWYNHLKKGGIRSFKGWRGVLLYHENSVSKALVDLFPDIGLDPTKICVPKEGWKDPHTRRTFFEQFAKEKLFDFHSLPLWKSYSKSISLSPTAKKVLSYHDGKVSKALHDLFPKVRFHDARKEDEKKWNKSNKAANNILDPNQKTSGINHTVENERRKFFEDYAKENKFDPHKPSNWYLQSSYKIMKSKRAQNVISFYESYPQALTQLFPDIGLDISKL